MRIVFVRHGEPDYKNDCLTDTGKKQAVAAADRLTCERISEIYSSPMGRAAETASYTATCLDLPVRYLEFMREISWGGEGIPADGHPWTLSSQMISQESFDFYQEDWRQHPFFKKNIATEYYDSITEQFDVFLCSQGYRHEKSRFYCAAETQKTIAIFSHGGSGACVLAHLLALPFPYVAAELPYDFTSITILDFPVKPHEYVHPHIKLFNDTRHIRDLSSGLVFQQKPQENLS